jgi:hypothetical protein
MSSKVFTAAERVDDTRRAWPWKVKGLRRFTLGTTAALFRALRNNGAETSMKNFALVLTLAFLSPCLAVASEVTGKADESGAPILVEEASVQQAPRAKKEMDPKEQWQIFDAGLSCPAGQLQYPKALDPESPRGKLLGEIENVYDGMAQLEHFYGLTGSQHDSKEVVQKEIEIEQQNFLARERVDELAREAQLPARGMLETIPKYRERLIAKGLLRRGADYVASCKQYLLQ